MQLLLALWADHSFLGRLRVYFCTGQNVPAEFATTQYKLRRWHSKQLTATLLIVDTYNWGCSLVVCNGQKTLIDKFLIKTYQLH